jgi:cellulose synthase/poly-beta-1,6-N-acetylglucosamine synthase-like glycosyltransferase
VVVISFLRGWNKLSAFKSGHPASKTTVSVIVAARNESASIKRLLDCLLDQDFPRALTEIIVVDDHSTDDTAEIIRSYGTRGIQLIQLNEDQPLNSYKKKAIERAIAQASGRLIVTTDADCSMGASWLSTVVDYYERNRYKMISSPVMFFEEKGLFERSQSLEFLYLIGLGASTIGNGKPSTCNGANLAYERDVFYEVGGFKGIDDLASGDDELLLHKIATRYPGQIGFVKSREAIVYTSAKPTLKELIRQRKRWASKSTKYKNKSIVLLGVGIWFFNLSIVANLLGGVFDLDFLAAGLIQLALKMTVELLFLVGVTEFAGRQRLLILLPLVSIFHVLYIVCIGIAGNSGKYYWKGREVR